MASKSAHGGEKEKFIPRQLPERKDHRHSEKVKDPGHRISLTRKLMLSAKLCGAEASVNFSQIYVVPCLQTLGMPLSLAYLSGVVAGPSAVFLIPFLAWLVDRGSNSQRRRIATIVFAAGLSLTGMLCLLTANALHLQDLLDYDGHKNTTFNASFSRDLSIRSNTEFRVSGPEILYNATSLGNKTYPPTSEEMSSTNAGLSSSSFIRSNGADTLDVNKAGSYVPFKAGLGVVAFVLLDMGFDISTCFVKAFVISCSPRAEQTSLLSLGLIMASMGGVCSAALNVVDFTSLLGLEYIEGVNLTIQTSVQGVVVIVLVVVGFLITLITGHRQLRHLNEQNSNTDIYNKDIVPASGDSLTRSTRADALENSIRSFRGAGIYFDPPPTVVKENASFNAEGVPLLSQEDTTKEEMGAAHLLSASISYGTVEPSLDNLDKPSYPIDKEKDEEESQEKQHPCQCRIQNPKIKIALVCLAVFFSNGCTIMVVYCISDFIGKAIYGGDPNAAPDSNSLKRYQEGMKMASWAFLTYYVSYFVASIANSKIMAFLGYRLEFVLVHVLTVVAMFTVAMTIRLEAVFVLTVMAGFLRMCLYVVPYAVANDIAQPMVKSGECRSAVGLAMSLVSAAIPSGNCLLFGWVGAAEDITGNASVPMFLGCVYGCLSLTCFLALGKV